MPKDRINEELTKYEILEIEKDATQRQIKDAYRNKIDSLFKKMKNENGDSFDNLNIDNFTHLYMNSFFDLYIAYNELNDLSKRESYNYRKFDDNYSFCKPSPLEYLYEGNNSYNVIEDKEMLNWLIKQIKMITALYDKFEQEEFDERLFHTGSIINGMIGIGIAIEKEINKINKEHLKCSLFADYIIIRANRGESKFNDLQYKKKRKEFLDSKNSSENY